MGVLVIVVLVGLVAIYEVPGLVKQKLKKELWVYSALLTFGFVLSVAETLKMEIPNPLDWITFIYQPIANILISFFK